MRQFGLVGKRDKFRAAFCAFALASAITLSSCGGSSSAPPPPAPPPPPPPPSSAPTVSISITTPSKTEGSSFAFTLTRSGDLSSASSVTYAVSGAADGADFTGGSLPSGTVSFSINASSTSLVITTANDLAVESNEAFTVTLSGPVNAIIGTGAASATIVNNDSVATAPIKIVILGASSAAGKNIWKLFPGTTVADEPAFALQYGWVSLYNQTLDAIDPANNVINLALSGYSTTRALNDKSGDASFPHSLAFALANHANADAFIINFPAIRGEEGETVAKVISNLTQMSNRALTAGVRQVWITTGQPTENTTDCFVINTSGSCHATLTVHQTRMDLTNQVNGNFPGRSLDFYRPLARNNSLNQTIDPALLNSADLTHPNVQGHIALKDAMIAAQVYESLK